jgi:hypothetical protein
MLSLHYYWLYVLNNYVCNLSCVCIHHCYHYTIWVLTIINSAYIGKHITCIVYCQVSNKSNYVVQVLSPCIPCSDECDHYNCDTACDKDIPTMMSFDINGLDLSVMLTVTNSSGHESTQQAVYFLVGMY